MQSIIFIVAILFVGPQKNIYTEWITAQKCTVSSTEYTDIARIVKLFLIRQFILIVVWFSMPFSCVLLYKLHCFCLLLALFIQKVLICSCLYPFLTVRITFYRLKGIIFKSWTLVWLSIVLIFDNNKEESETKDLLK